MLAMNRAQWAGGIKKMDAGAKTLIYSMIGSAWAMLLYGVFLSLSSGRLVIDTGAFTVLLGIVGTLCTALVSGKVAVGIHRTAQADKDTSTPSAP